MSPKTFVAIAVAAVVAVAAAGISVALQPGYGDTGAAGQRMFPDLLERVNDVASVVIEAAKGTLSVTRRDGGWVLAEGDGYPARAGKVRAVVVGLARLTYLEPKTRRKDRYAKLNLRDPESEDALSRRLTLKAAGGEVLARVIVGRRNFSFQADGAVYVRKPDDAQSWLARGTLELGTQPSDWLRPMIVDIKPGRIARVVVRHADGKTVVASRASPEDKNFTIENLPAGARLKSESAADNFSLALENLQLVEVRKADAIAFPEDATVKAEITTFDGLTARLTLAEVDGKDWLRLSFSARAAGKESADGKDVAKEAADLAVRTEGWVYRISGYRAVDLKKRMADLIKLPNPS